MNVLVKGWLGKAVLAQGALWLVLLGRAQAGTIYNTFDASNITQVSATLNGRTDITCSQGGVTMSFEYGPTNTYGTTVASVPGTAAGNAGQVTTHADLTGLTCNTTYHFRHSGTTCQTTIQGSDATFTTLPCAAPNPPTGVMATAGNAQATVTFTAPNDNGAAITGYVVTSIPGGGVDSNANSTSLSHVVTGLTNGTPYTFTVKATNASGTSNASEPSSGVTPMAPVDMTVLPDLSTPADMTASPDLSMPADMTVPRDLSTPADMTGPATNGGCSVTAAPGYGDLFIVLTLITSLVVMGGALRRQKP